MTLMKRFCRENPVERIGYQKDGVNDIKKHRWFQVIYISLSSHNRKHLLFYVPMPDFMSVRYDRPSVTLIGFKVMAKY